MIGALLPVDPDEGFAAAGEGADGAAVSALAICSKGVKLRYRAKIVGASQLITAKLGCGKGKGWRVTSGGVWSVSGGSAINSSHPYDGNDRDRAPDDGWRIRILRGGIPGSVTIHVICARGLKLAYKRSKKVAIGPGNETAQVRSLAPGCGKKRHVVGGGPKLTGLINRARIVSSIPVDGPDADKVPDDRWRSKAVNFGGSGITMRAFAICARR